MADLKEKLETKDKLKKIQSLGLQMVKGKEIDLVESVSKVNYANGLSFFATHGIRTHENEAGISHFEGLIQAYLNLLGP